MHIRQVLPSAYLGRMTVQVIDSSIFQGEKEGRVVLIIIGIIPFAIGISYAVRIEQIAG